MNRRLVFRVVEHECGVAPMPAYREQPPRDSATPGTHRLVRTLAVADARNPR